MISQGVLLWWKKKVFSFLPRNFQTVNFYLNNLYRAYQVYIFCADGLLKNRYENAEYQVIKHIRCFLLLISFYFIVLCCSVLCCVALCRVIELDKRAMCQRGLLWCSSLPIEIYLDWWGLFDDKTNWNWLQSHW